VSEYSTDAAGDWLSFLNMNTIISMPTNAVASTTAAMSDLFNDFSPMIFLIGGVLLGLLIIGAFISFLRH
jgi:hypothetical protein